MRKPKNIKKVYEKRYWNDLTPGGKPRKTDLAGANSAYSYANRHKDSFKVHIEKDDKVYWVWRIM
jgi:hypothetical protein